MNRRARSNDTSLLPLLLLLSIVRCLKRGTCSSLLSLLLLVVGISKCWAEELLLLLRLLLLLAVACILVLRVAILPASLSLSHHG